MAEATRTGGHLTIQHVPLQAVLEHLTSQTTVASSTGGQLEKLRDGVTPGSGDPRFAQGRAEERLLASAAVIRCVDTLQAAPNLYRIGEACVHVRAFAVRAGIPEGAAVVGILRAYLPWATQWPENGLVHVYQWMRVRRPSLTALDAHGESSVAQAFRAGKAKPQRMAAAILVADAEIVLSAWVELWNRKQERRGCSSAPPAAA